MLKGSMGSKNPSYFIKISRQLNEFLSIERNNFNVNKMKPYSKQPL